MNADQKQRAAELLAAWRATAYALHADRMADLLNELLAATNPAQISSLAEPQPPAPSVPDGWRPFLTDVITAAGLLEHGKRDKGLADRIGSFAFAAMRAAPTPAEPPADLVRNAEPVGYLYTNVQSGEYHVSDYDDDYRGPERVLWHIEPVYRKTKGQS